MASEPIDGIQPQGEGESGGGKGMPSAFRSPEPERVAIAPSESFEYEDAARFLARTEAIVVTLIGDRESGKSTLICSIYDRFLHGPFAGLQSSGVLTITGLEKRAHLERVESGKTTPDTQHTSLGEGLRYFHFGTSSEEEREKRSAILVSDRAGESYKNARGNPTLLSALIELPLADYLVVMVDGRRVAELTTRAGSFFAVRQMLQLLADHQPKDANYQIEVVITKVDLIETAQDAVELRASINDFKNRLKGSFADRFNSLVFFEIAARATQGEYPAAYGVEQLLQSWLIGPKVRSGVSASKTPVETEFDLLVQRTDAPEPIQ
jgi:hypothetical protein